MWLANVKVHRPRDSFIFSAWGIVKFQKMIAFNEKILSIPVAWNLYKEEITFLSPEGLSKCIYTA